MTSPEPGPLVRAFRVQVFGPQAGQVTALPPGAAPPGAIAGHRFAGMQSEPNEPPLAADPAGRNRYRGTCLCGHTERWTTVKDWAWAEIATHFAPLITGEQA
jgi:hypothetical protein